MLPGSHRDVSVCISFPKYWELNTSSSLKFAFLKENFDNIEIINFSFLLGFQF